MPSAGGPRAPLARQVSHLVTTIGAWAVNFWGNRCFAYYRYEEAELFRSLLRLVIGFIINWDLAPMRVWVNNEDLRSHEIAVTVLRSIDSDGQVSAILSPKMSRPENAKASGILGSILRYNLFVGDLISSSPGIKFLS